MSLFALSDEETQLQAAVRGLLNGFVDNTYLNLQEESPTGYEPRRWRQLAEMGLTGLHIPVESGGAGGTLIDAAVVLRECGRAAYATPLLQTLRAATVLDATKAAVDVLAQIAGGDAAALVSAPDRGILAERSSGGYVLRGGPVLVEWASQSTWLVVLVPTPSGQWIGGALAVEDVAGRLTDVPSIDNERMALLDPEGLEIPGEPSRVAEVAGDIAQRAAVRAELLRASVMTGGAQAVVDMTGSYVRERRQFDKPLAAFQAVKHHAARMVIAADGAQLLCDDAVARMEADPSETAIARAAVFAAGRSYVEVVLTAAQLHGGMGTTIDHILHHHFRRAKAMQLRSGRRSTLLRELHRELVIDRGAVQRSLW